MATLREEALIEAIKELAGWIECWRRDVAFGLKPTVDSLEQAKAFAKAALTDSVNEQIASAFSIAAE